MTDGSPQSAAWSAVLPPGTTWVAPGVPTGSGSRAVLLRPWAVSRTPRHGGGTTWRPYVAVPSQQAPVLIASKDAGVLRYVSGSLMSVPPGAGQVASLVLTAGLRLLRFRLVWNLVAALRVARLVAVGRSR